MTLDNQYGQKSILVAIPELLTARGVGAILGISAKTVHKLVREKKAGCVPVTSCERRSTHEQIEDCAEHPHYFQRPRMRNGAPARFCESNPTWERWCNE